MVQAPPVTLLQASFWWVLSGRGQCCELGTQLPQSFIKQLLPQHSSHSSAILGPNISHTLLLFTLSNLDLGQFIPGCQAPIKLWGSGKHKAQMSSS